MLAWLEDRRIEHPWTDWAVAALLVGAHAAAVLILGRGDVLYSMGLDRRLDLYGSALTVTGVIVGFALTTFTFYYSAGGERMTAVRAEAGPRLTAQWLAALRFPLLGLVVFFVVKAADGTAPHGHYGAASNVRWVFEVTAVMVALRLSRLVTIFSDIAGVRSLDESVKTPRLMRSEPIAPIPEVPRRANGG